MRFLVVQPGVDWSVHDVYAGWCEALVNARQKMVPFNLNDRLVFYDKAFEQVGEKEFRKALDGPQAIEHAVNGLYATLYKNSPDVLLVICGFLIPAELLDLARFRGSKVVVVHTESPYEDERQIELAAHADFNIINDPINLARFQAVAPTVYIPHAYRTHMHRPGPADPDMASDFTFVGTGFQSRIDFLEAMDLDGIEVFLAGNWQRLQSDSPLQKHLGHGYYECLDNIETVNAYRSSKVGINYYRRNPGEPTDGWAMGPREVEMAATGLFYLRDPRPEGDELLPMLPTFGSPGEASEQLRWFLAHPDERQKAADAARAAVADRTFDNNVAVLLRHLEKG